jgi:hypothetical protein
MTVGELIETLQTYDQHRLVVCQQDAEGNSFSPLVDVWDGAYLAETTWYGEAGLEKLTKEDIDRGFDEEDVIENGVPALFLVPTN